jgi:hypothetical protein
MFAKHRSQRALRRFRAPLQASAVPAGHALANISIAFEHEQLFNSRVPDSQRASEGVFFHLVQRLSCLRRIPNRRLQLFCQFDQRFALDFLSRMRHAHCAASMPG